MERNWRLDDDLIASDNVLDGFTFDDLILAVHHNSEVSPKTVRQSLKDIIEARLEDMYFLVEQNMDIIMERALEGRGK